MSLQIDIDQISPDHWDVVLSGSLDSDTSPALEKALAPALSPETRHIAFNMSGVKFISSAGIRIFAIATRTMTANGGAVTVTELQPQIQKVFDIVKALPNLGVFAGRAEADEYFAEMQRQTLEGK